jgi:mRNA interferase RelE/StbE
MYQIQISNSFYHQFRKLAAKNQQRVKDAIADLSENPRPPGVKKLVGQGNEDDYRIRVGDYRVLFHINDKSRQVIVYRVNSRENVY